MAKHVILEAYTFTPGTSTVVVTGKNIRREQLLLITNVTQGTVIYNFSDPSIGFASYTNAVDTVTGQETTTIVLEYNTAAMSSTDKLAILTEETYTEITPSEVLRDPVDKLRVSTPQALIDTDFEYGVQPTKWESVNLVNNRPTAFYDPTLPIQNITNITATGKVVTVALPATAGITVGSPIFIVGSLDTANVDGWWIVESVSANTNFTFTVTGTPAASLYDSTKTYAFVGSFYTGSAINAASITIGGGSATVTCNVAHGLQPGTGIYIVGTTGATGTLNSSWVVATTPTANIFTFVTAATGTITLAGGALGTLYARPLGYVTHRAFDGGVQFTNVQPYHGYQVIRQTRRQFRYQSGKGIQFSTGTTMKPALAIDTVTASGTTVTVSCKFAHGLLPGAYVKVANCNETAYNGTFQVITVANALTFTYTAGSAPSATPATGFPIYINPTAWYGSSNRIGMFDNQNGFYFEFDGQTLYTVSRRSVRQLSGSTAVSAGSQSVVGTNTKFSTQLAPGDFIVLRGMSYMVQSITSDTQINIFPEYRGVTTTNVVPSKTYNARVAQSAWNIDKMDGTGASLMTLDLTKMQMLYIDYTWYGAGAIRFGFKNNRGEVIYCHRVPNNNVNPEAYMRSGNLVARYETNTIAPTTYLTATVASGATTGASIQVADASTWPSAGTVILTAAGTNTNIEYVSYSAKPNNQTLTIANRIQTGGTGTAATFTYSASAPTQAQLYSPQVASVINHWGSSVIMDGRFDNDKSYVFSAGYNTSLQNLPVNTRVPIISIRVAPSVDNGLTGQLGYREIVNRMQLTLNAMDAYTTGTSFRVELILNGQITTTVNTWTSVGGSSLAQVSYHTTATRVTGGESVFGFFTNVGAATSQDLAVVRDIGNSILGGGTTSTVSATALNVFPDGPDILTVCATAIGGGANSINSRISWTEAQA
jgi:hypothetical protein